MLPLLVLLGSIAGAWYLLIVRPQKNQGSQHAQLLSQLKVGDYVLTVGGLYGRVSETSGSTLLLELAPGVSTRITIDGVARIVNDVQATNEPPKEMKSPEMQQPYSAPQIPSFGNSSSDQSRVSTNYQTGSVRVNTQPPMAHHQPDRVQITPQQFASQQDTRQGSARSTPLPWRDVAPIQLPPPPQIAYAHDLSQPAVHAPFASVHGSSQGAISAQIPAPMVAPINAQIPQQYPRPQIPQQMLHYQHGSQIDQQTQYSQQPEPAPTKHSKAPQGMGSTIRLDDPALADVLQRARNERAALADEYRKALAPFVETQTPPQYGNQSVMMQANSPLYGAEQAANSDLFQRPTPMTQHGYAQMSMDEAHLAPTGTHG